MEEGVVDGGRIRQGFRGRPSRGDGVAGLRDARGSGVFPDDFQEKAQTDIEDKLAVFCDEHIASKIGAHSVVRVGNVYEEILKLADEISCDLIVMASHRPELKDYLLGPNAARVVRHANCSVLVVWD